METTQFTCLALNGLTDQRVDDLGLSHDLGHGYRLDRSKADFDLTSWTAYVGEQEVESIRGCNAWIWVEGLDSVVRRQRLGYFETALHLTRAPLIRGSWIIEGLVENGAVRVSSFGTRRESFIKEPAFPLLTITLNEAAKVAELLARMFEAKLLAGRLERGFVSLILAMRVEYIEDSILYLMRALEGMLHADSSKEFQARAACILLDPRPDLLREVYHVRNKFTHAEPVALAFPNLTEPEGSKRARQLQAFLYHFATRAYRRIIGDAELLTKLSQHPVGELWGNVLGQQRPPFSVRVDDDLWNHDHELGHYLIDPIEPGDWAADLGRCC